MSKVHEFLTDEVKPEYVKSKLLSLVKLRVVSSLLMAQRVAWL